MAAQSRTIIVPLTGELARLLDEADDGPLVLERNGVRYQLDRENEQLFRDYDPAKALVGIRVAGGSWRDLNAEQLKVDLYRAREEGTRPPDRS